jgi:hypothetical protein
MLCVIFMCLTAAIFIADSAKLSPLPWGTMGPAGGKWEGLHQPVSFRSLAAVEKWKIMNLTTKTFLNALSGNLTNVYLSNSPLFPYFDEWGLQNSIFSENFTRPYVLENIAPTAIFQQNSGNYRFKYYSGNLMNPTFKPIIQEFEPGDLVNNSITVTAWLGTAGVLTPTHYDDSHNVYVQLSGVKRFRLFPHNSTRSLCLHGRLHPHARQSRITELGTTVRMRPIYSNGNYLKLSQKNLRSSIYLDCDDTDLSGFEILLGPGNVLYIPPFWYHEVLPFSSSHVSFW